jgi:mxaJ protein
VTRRGAAPPRSLNDPRLRHLRIGVHVIGDDYNALPPALALSRRGLIRNLRGYSIYGNDAHESPPSTLIAAVARGDVDVAVAWGPLAGYYATREGTPLVLTPVTPQIDLPFLPFVYDISFGVQRGDSTRMAQLEASMQRQRPAVRAILRDYGVPLVDSAAAPLVGAPVASVPAAPRTRDTVMQRAEER